MVYVAWTLCDNFNGVSSAQFRTAPFPLAHGCAVAELRSGVARNGAEWSGEEQKGWLPHPTLRMARLCQRVSRSWNLPPTRRNMGARLQVDSANTKVKKACTKYRSVQYNSVHIYMYI